MVMIVKTPGSQMGSPAAACTSTFPFFFSITGNSSLEPLLKGLLTQIHMDLSFRGFNRTGDLWITHIIVWIIDSRWSFKHLWWLHHTATYRNTMQHAAIHCNTLEPTATVTHCFSFHPGNSNSVGKSFLRGSQIGSGPVRHYLAR